VSDEPTERSSRPKGVTSQTANSCTDEQEPHIEAGVSLGRGGTSHRSPLLYHIRGYVDAAAIGGKLMSLPGEVFVTTCGLAKKSAEVIVLIGNEPIPLIIPVEIGGLTTRGRTEH
jgi:hypothetical protein